VDSLQVGYPDIHDLSNINAGLTKRSEVSSYLGDQNINAIGVSYTPGSTIDKNGITKSSFQCLGTSGLKNLPIMRLF